MTCILVVEDEPLVRDMLRRALARPGYTVLAAEDGAQGLDLFRREAPEVVISDIIMPQREGIELMATIKKESPETRIIAMSGGGRARFLDLLRIAINIGADVTLEKPFRREELLRVVEAVLPPREAPP